MRYLSGIGYDIREEGSVDLANVRRSPYRQPLTPDGLEGIEKGSLDYFDREMFNNFNTGALEQYLENKNMKESFHRSHFDLKKVLMMIILVGLPFTLVTQYVALSTGIMIGGAYYIIYILGLSLKWSPTEINIGSGAATAAEKTIIGFAYTFPAIYLLSIKGVEGFDGIVVGERFSSIALLITIIVCSIFASFLGLMYFIIFRRIWIVEDPLPIPSFQAYIRLLDISRSTAKKEGEVDLKKIMKRFFTPFLSMIIIGCITRLEFLRDRWASSGEGNISILHYLMSGMGLRDWYYEGLITTSPKISKFTSIDFSISGMYFALGWFLRLRASSMILLGSLFSWFVIVPMAVLVGVPLELGVVGGEGYSGPATVLIGADVLDYGLIEDITGNGSSVSGFAFSEYAQPIALGAIIGAGSFALLKLIPSITKIGDELKRDRKVAKNRRTVERVAYEWPVKHIIPTTIITAFVFWLLFWTIGGFGFLPSLLLGLIITPIIFILSALTAKITGEIGIVPTSTMTLLLVIVLFYFMRLLFLPARIDMENGELILMVLLASTIFTCTISLSSDIMWDFKVGLYAGTRPYHLVKGESLGILIGVPIAGTLSILFSTLVIDGTLAAPQATVLAGFSEGLIGGDLNWNLVLIGLLIGSLAEIMTGMGTAFGIGMIIHLYVPLGIILGAVAREIWEKRWLNKNAEKWNWSDTKKTMKLMDSYIVMIGLIVGEAIFGAVLALFFLLSAK
jgi:uncharacterized oligopeptide transporter (OPT) family protein